MSYEICPLLPDTNIFSLTSETDIMISRVVSRLVDTFA